MTNNAPILSLGATEFLSPKAYLVTEGVMSSLIVDSRLSDASYYDFNGILQSAVSNLQRINYPQDGSGDFGLFVEGAATNICLQSENLSVTWTNVNSAETTNVTLSPRAVADADLLVVDTANAAHAIEQTYTGSTSVDFCGSVFAKQNSHTDMYLRLSDAADTDYIDIIVDLSDGAILQAATATGGNATVTGGNVETLVNGWYRIWVSGICDSTLTAHKIVVGISQGTTISYTGNGTDSIFAWGAQVEQGSFPTSYIPTLTVSTLRPADVNNLDLTAFSDFSATEGSLYVDFKRDVNTDGLTTHVVNLNDTTANEVIKISQGNTTATDVTGDIIDGGASQFSVTVSDASVNVRKKVAMAWKLNDTAIAVDGSTPTTDTSCTLPTVTDLLIGSGTVATESFYGIIRELTYYDTRLPNATLTSLTT